MGRYNQRDVEQQIRRDSLNDSMRNYDRRVQSELPRQRDLPDNQSPQTVVDKRDEYRRRVSGNS